MARQGRPPRPLGVAGKVTLSELAAGHFEAVVRVRDATGKRTRIKRVSPPKFDNRGRRVPDTNGSRARDAVLEEAAKVVATIEGALKSSTRARVLWTTYREYLVNQSRSDNTLRLYDRWADAFVTAYGERQLIEVSTETIEAFLKKVAEEHGPGSAKTARSMLSGMFRLAVRRSALSVNPVREAELVRNAEAKRPTGGARQIEIDELRFILAAVGGSIVPCPRIQSRQERERATAIKSYAPPTVADYCEGADLADYVILSAGSAQRPSQVLAVDWDDIDVDGKRMRTTGKVVRIAGKGLVRLVKENDPKNPGGWIALPDFAVQMLKRRKAALAARQLASAIDHDDPTVNVKLVFPSTRWTLRDPQNVQHEWQRVREALGLPDDVKLYSFRKAVATILDDAGLSARITADVLQHADPAMTQRKYMARGRTHPQAAAALQLAVVGDDEQ